MPFFGDRRLDTYLILGDGREPLPSHWEGWREAARRLDPLLQGRQVAVRPSYTFAAGKTQYGSTKFDRPKFGRLAWNARSHDTWPFGAPHFPRTKGEATFHGVQVWSPSWGACERRSWAPEIFFHHLGLWKNYGDFPPFTLSVLGVAVDDPGCAMAEQVALSFADCVGRWFVARRRNRRWTCDDPPRGKVHEPATMPCSLIDSTFLRKGGMPEPAAGRVLGPADWLIEPFEPIG